jgi:hypothetical protein
MPTDPKPQRGGMSLLRSFLWFGQAVTINVVLLRSYNSPLKARSSRAGSKATEVRIAKSEVQMKKVRPVRIIVPLEVIVPPMVPEMDEVVPE